MGSCVGGRVNLGMSLGTDREDFLVLNAFEECVT